MFCSPAEHHSCQVARFADARSATKARDSDPSLGLIHCLVCVFVIIIIIIIMIIMITSAKDGRRAV